MTTLQIRVGGTWLSSLGGWGDPAVTHEWPLGCTELAWSMLLPALHRPPGIVRGALVDAYIGATSIWSGYLSEPNWSDGEFTATGLFAEAEGALCLTGGGVATATPDTAVDAGISRGALHWVRDTSLSNTVYGDADETDSLNYVKQMLDDWSTEQSKRWAVGPDKRVYAAADPTVPAWYVTPGTGDLGVADDDYVTHVIGRYRNPLGVLATVTASDTSQGAGRREKAVDLRPKGRITSTRAQNLVNGILSKTKARTGWANGVTVSREQITSPGGVTPHLSQVKAGQMVRLLGVPDPRGVTSSVDVVVGRSVWSLADGTVVLSPVDQAATDFASVVAAMGGVAA